MLGAQIDLRDYIPFSIGVHGGGNMLLRLHRLRHHRHHGGGSDQPEKIDTAGHHIQLGHHLGGLRHQLNDDYINW